MSWFPWSKKKPKTPAPKPAAGDQDRREQIVRMMRLLRKRLSPQVLKLGQDVVSGKAEVVNQQNARKAIELFLANQKDGGAYREKLAQFIKKNSSTH